MSAIIYYISLPFIYFISILPFWVLYRISDGFYFFLFYVFRYRKKVVISNLKNAFPEKSEKEIEQICKRFYSFLCDLIFETIKTLTISKQEAVKRCRLQNESLLNQLYEKKKNIILVLGHYGNWELGGASMGFQSKYQLYVLYKPLSNKLLDQLVFKMRTRLGTQLIIMEKAYRHMVNFKNSDEVSATAFIADQTPFPEKAYWTTFLNQETPVFFGTETIAAKLNYPIVYISVKRVKRGYYEMIPEILCEHPKDTNKGFISELHTKRLEKDIVAQPEIWLWSHKRWKHKKPL